MKRNKEEAKELVIRAYNVLCRLEEAIGDPREIASDPSMCEDIGCFEE